MHKHHKTSTTYGHTSFQLLANEQNVDPCQLTIRGTSLTLPLGSPRYGYFGTSTSRTVDPRPNAALHISTAP